MLYRGEGGPRDLAEARRLFGLSAAQGDAAAQCNLGTMHHRGDGGPEDSVEARRLYDLAAAQGDAYAQCRLAWMHHRGEGGPQDVELARRLFGATGPAPAEGASAAGASGQ